MIVEHRLAGCHPEPLASYLKALGLLRLVHEQTDPGATGHWSADGFVLRTVLSEEALEGFFVADYRPTPIVSPWNNSSGFGPEGSSGLGVIERSGGPRFGPYRETIAVARDVLSGLSWETLPDKEQKARKRELIVHCRNRFPDAALPWLDASVVLVETGLAYPPMLGSGGNDGRLEFSRNFHQHLVSLFLAGAGKRLDTRALLRAALDDIADTKVGRGSSAGQFDGGAVGGPNSASTGAADALLNPWDWVLLIEGSVLFAAGAARRMATSGGRGVAAAPFAVGATAAGFASATEGEGSRGEVWLPLWEQPATLPEVRKVFSEGRADWRGRKARTGLELAKAVADMGAERGISAFTRHAVLERNGRNFVSTPAGRIAVGQRQAAVPLGNLDDWLDQVKRGATSSQVQALLRVVERLSFAAATGRGDVFEVLAAAAALDMAVARSPRAREQVGALRLKGEVWAPVLLDERPTAELRLALSLASLRGGPGRDPDSFRSYIRSTWTRAKTLEAPFVAGLGSRKIVDLLADIHARRVVELDKRRPGGSRRPGEQPGIDTTFDFATSAALPDLAALVAGTLDEPALDLAVQACSVLAFTRGFNRGTRDATIAVHPALALLGPFFAKREPMPKGGGTQWSARLTDATLLPDRMWPAQLSAGAAGPPLRGAVRRLAVAGLQPAHSSPTALDALVRSVDSATARRLGAALLCPIGPESRLRLLRLSCPDPDVDPRHGRADPSLVDEDLDLEDPTQSDNNGGINAQA